MQASPSRYPTPRRSDGRARGGDAGVAYTRIRQLAEGGTFPPQRTIAGRIEIPRHIAENAPGPVAGLGQGDLGVRPQVEAALPAIGPVAHEEAAPAGAAHPHAEARVGGVVDVLLSLGGGEGANDPVGQVELRNGNVSSASRVGTHAEGGRGK